VHDAYRAAAKLAHPDAGGTPEAFRALQSAYAQARAHFGQAGGGDGA
jgi:curved DNA-binding protein CbpA